MRGDPGGPVSAVSTPPALCLDSVTGRLDTPTSLMSQAPVCFSVLPISPWARTALLILSDPRGKVSQQGSVVMSVPGLGDRMVLLRSTR